MKRILYSMTVLTTVFACEKGLTQLRHRDSLALMRCVPTMPGQADPCIVLTGGRMAWCQHDVGEYVCCGTAELLIQLIAGKISLPVLSDPWSFYARGTKVDYNVLVPPKVQNTYAMPPVLTTPKPPLYHPLFSFPTPKPQKPATSLIQLSVPLFESGNFSNSLRVATNVFAIQDGDCSIVVNTGLPNQKAEIIRNLNASGISINDIQFLVITSAQPQFIGNLNVFPSSQVVIEQHYTYKDHIIHGGIEEVIFQNTHVEMCSPSTFLLATPGPTPHATTVFVHHVPFMGTVAIAGSLFLKDDKLVDIEPDFTWDARNMLKSRRIVVCKADWIIPAHAVPFPVTPSLRRSARCDKLDQD